MIERINLLLKAKNLTARQFAEEIGIQPSGMSHIMSGRNNPSLDFVMKVMRRWPEVNINWLMFGKGEMYASLPLNANLGEKHSRESDIVSDSEGAGQYDLFGQTEQKIKEINDEEQEREVVTQHPRQEPPYVDKVGEVKSVKVAPLSQDDTAAPSTVKMLQSSDNAIETEKSVAEAVQPVPKKKKVVKMIVMYDDHSFAEYYPE